MTDIQSRYYHLIHKVTEDFKEQASISDRDILLVLLKTTNRAYREYIGSESKRELDRIADEI